MKKLLILALLLTGLSGAIQAKGIELLGAGSTFVYPLYAKMFDVYAKQTGEKVNYQPIGSGGGQLQLINKVVDFGASDVFMTDSQLQGIPEKILHLPICLGAVSITYQLPGNPVVKFTPSILADIFLGNITKWNDPRIKKVNPALALPPLPILTVHRSDGSGTTGIFTSYLSKVSPAWRKAVGDGLSVNWPSGLGAKGSAGVAGLLRQTPGSIGYVELIYALQNNMPQGVIANRSGKFIKPSLASTSLAGNVPLPADTRILVTDSKVSTAYPISGFTWLIFYREQNYGGRSLEKAKALAELFRWMIHEGQPYAKMMQYAPLPPKAVKVCDQILHAITYHGKPVL